MTCERAQLKSTLKLEKNTHNSLLLFFLQMYFCIELMVQQHMTVVEKKKFTEMSNKLEYSDCFWVGNIDTEFFLR